ncbi:glycosyltransferase [Litchfieldella xinjiangensis]|uniref:glycosyltransferase n=1 Tax=Litchfieldella xinjiangensis TaxID=1166948 RepID=UPI000B1CFEFA|nr:glycosyltransferase [Halomonas xinjiangensis]
MTAFNEPQPRKRLRTLVVVKSTKMGGMERVAVNLADAFADEGHESHLLTFVSAKRSLHQENESVQRHRLPLQRWQRLTVIGVFVEMLSRWFLNPVIRRSHFVWTGWLGGWLFRVWLTRFERRYGPVDLIVFRGVGTFERIWTFNDPRARFVLENLMYRGESGWKGKLFAWVLFHRKRLVAVSQGVADNIRDASQVLDFTPASLSVIPNPCPIDSIRQAMREVESQLPVEPYIVNVARLVPAKDQALLLRAYAKAQPRERLVLVGGGQERPRLEALAEELGISERVIFAGQQANPYPWMHHARLFVLSSRFEGMGIVLFEALACGTPVLSVDCPGGIREILKGPLETSVVERDVDSLATGISTALAGEKPAIDEAWLNDFLPSVVVEKFVRS